ncbi:MAG: PilZ domain-containing protein [Actinomycetota bacterium]|nr:PilZ domain-containing protein [Actinomycetota bacterium]
MSDVLPDTAIRADIDRPEERASADVTLVAHGITVTAAVELSGSGLVVVRPEGDGTAWKAAVGRGEAVELYWVGGEEERTLNGLVTEVEDGADGGDARWHLSVNGPATRSQRRKAVRARVQVPVLIPWAGAQLTGNTVDLSEAGIRALMDGWGVPLEPGTACQVSLDLDDVLVHLIGEVVWTHVRGAQWLMAIKFVDVAEQAGDVLRRRVFKALRDERALERS